MNMLLWIGALPAHMREAWSAIQGGWTLEGMRKALLRAFLIVSAFATAMGLKDLISGGVDAPPVIELVGGMAMAACVVLFMYLSLETVLRDPRPLWKIIAAFAYVFFMLWSVGFGFGFYWKMCSASDVAERQAVAMKEGLQRSLDQSIFRLKGIDAAANDLTLLAKGRTEKERAGNGCDNVVSLPGEGPLFNIRASINQSIETQQSSLKSVIDLPGLKAEVETTQRQIAGILSAQHVGQAGLKRNIDQARGLANGAISKVNASIGTTRDYAPRYAGLAEELRKGRQDGASVCRDTELARGLDIMAEKLRTTQDIPPITDETFKINLGADATRAAFDRIWAYVLTPIGLSTEKPRPLTQEDMVAFIAAIAVDLGILLATLFGWRTEPLARLSNDLTGAINNRRLRRQIADLARVEPEGLGVMLDRASIVCDRRFYLVTSEDVPQYHASFLNIQAALIACGAGKAIRLPTGPRPRRSDASRPPGMRSEFLGVQGAMFRPYDPWTLLSAAQRQLARTSVQLSQDVEARIPADRISILRVPPAVMASLKAEAARAEQSEAGDGEGPRPASAAPPPRPGGPQPGPRSAFAENRRSGPGPDSEPPVRAKKTKKRSRKARPAEGAPQPAA
ncbi:MAG: hypothetical protein QM608_08245, partial [Caulobacter sp.]